METKRAYTVDITQIRQISIDVYAENEKEALVKAKKKYLDNETNFENSTVVATEFDINK